MKGIIILAHGSRRTSTEKTLVQIIDLLKVKMCDYKIEYAFMEFSKKTIPLGLDALVAQGITEIVAVPYFLFDGVHIHEDIPEELAKYTENHPEVHISLGKTLGADPRLADILTDRVLESL